jgi:hypothetical protein
MRPLGHDAALALLRCLASQTLLFVGPERVGRRLAARWYAAWLNCEAGGQLGGGDEPCGSCGSCRAMLLGSHPDYRELAPELTTRTGRHSRRPQIRLGDLVPREGGNPEPLSSWLEARPRARARVGVIDQAEALGEGAANAFLKFLEEPPSYARIVLIAPSPQAVLATIASRSTVVRFGALDLSLLAPGFDHPLARLGRPGDIGRAETEEGGVLETVDSYLLSLPKGLDEALGGADLLEKRWSAGGEAVAEVLRARLATWPPAAYAAALEAVERCEGALEVYAAAPLAVQVLTLELRDLARRE